MKKYFVFFLTLATVFVVSYFVKIDTGLYYLLSPIVRWKFAIYTGECNAETGCHFQKMEETGTMEYFGLKKIPFVDKELLSANKNSLISNTAKISQDHI